MYFLAIETSCDETSLAVLEYGGEHIQGSSFVAALSSCTVLSHIIASQAELFAKYGGVIPEISARNHASQIFELFELLSTDLEREHQITKQQLLASLEAIFVTTEPGLASALRVGHEFARVISAFASSRPQVVPTNHLRGHIASCFVNPRYFENINPFPHLHLLVSGGNTQILRFDTWVDSQVVAQTQDDAAGECLDKGGRMLGIPYPAGPKIGKIAGARSDNPLDLPISMKSSAEVNFSYSGLKTAMRNKVQKCGVDGIVYEQQLTQAELEILYAAAGNPTDLSPKLMWIQSAAISLQMVVVSQLINQFKKQMAQNPVLNSIGLSGGVSANALLRSQFERLHEHVFICEARLSGDNAVMIGLAGVADRFTSP
jgi:N6-L-threonylcarbamoyladenine synthase